MIKVVTLEYEAPFTVDCRNTNIEHRFTTKYKYFKTYQAENGQAVYTVDGELVTKEEGNKLFTDIANKYTHKATIHRVEANNSEICEKLEKCIDPYYFYIDDTNDMERAKKDNEKVRDILNAFIEVAGC